VKYGVKTYGMSEPFHREVTKSLLQRSEAAGFEAIVVRWMLKTLAKSETPCESHLKYQLILGMRWFLSKYV
jgi:hypothetical protein